MNTSRRDTFLLLLSLTAGAVDAMAFLQSGVFPANMTGNSVVLALALLRVNSGGVFLAGLALFGYCLGSIVGSVLTREPNEKHLWTPQISFSFFLGGLLLLGCSALLGIFGNPILPLIIFLAAAAMGLQSAAVLRLGVAGVATVVVTGTLTTALMRISGKFVQSAGKQESPWLPGLSWLAYFGGALLGALPQFLHAPWLVPLPGVLLLAIAGTATFQARNARVPDPL